MKPALLESEAQKLFRLLKKTKKRIVFAESCTGGMIGAAMTQIPGVSEYFCGSWVTYRNKSKANWLDVPARYLKNPGPVSEEVAVCMAIGALNKTSEAGIAAAITGHLGPRAEKGKNGLLYIGIAERLKNKRIRFHVTEHWLQRDSGSRAERQMAASHSVLLMVRLLLEREQHHTNKIRKG